MASSKVTKFVNRAPRYTLLADDRKIIRYTKGPQRERKMATEILNISETGLAFAVEQSMSPRLGEKIAVEFKVPGSQQMACYAQVTRIDKEEKDGVFELRPRVIVAVQFVNLYESHEKNLSDGLHKKFATLSQDQHNEQKRIQRMWLWQHKGELAILFFAHSIMVLTFFLASHPLGLKLFS